MGHGNQVQIGSHYKLNKTWVNYSDISDNLKYRLAFILLNCCNGGCSWRDTGFNGRLEEMGGRDLSSQYGDYIFFGHKVVLVPFIWHYIRHPSEFLTGGKQGTKIG